MTNRLGIILHAAVFLFLGQTAVMAIDKPVSSWFFAYPMFNQGNELLPSSEADTITTLACGFPMYDIENVIDYARLQQQIDYAGTHNLGMSIISESNPYYVPRWLSAKLQASGEMSTTITGANGTIASMFSPEFDRVQDHLLASTLDYVKKNDPKHLVRYYHPGAEWSVEYKNRYGKYDISAFREWLKKRYTSIDKLNNRWGAKYASFDEADAPKQTVIHSFYGSSQFNVGELSDVQDEYAWSNGNRYEINPNSFYTASAWIKTENLKGSAFLDIACTKSDSEANILAIYMSPVVKGTHGWQKVSIRFKPHKDFGKAWIQLKLTGSGTAWYDDISLVEEGSSKNLLYNPGFEDTQTPEPDRWSFINWANQPGVKSEYLKEGGRNNSRCVSITGVLRLDYIKPGYANKNAAEYDWTEFWYESVAKYADKLAGKFKKLDPTRPTVNYLTFAFAYMAEWDYSQWVAVAPDEFAIQGKNTDMFGLQVCSAEKDPYRVTASLDMMRKYNKPMWAVDLVDFTSGVHIGRKAMERVTHSAIQHGASGIVYCCWHLPFAMDYSFYPNWNDADRKQIMTTTKQATSLVNGMKPSASGAIIMPILPVSSADVAGQKNDFRSFMGWYKILERMNRTVDVVTLRELDKGAVDLTKYSWVIVPDCAYLSRKSLSALEKYGQTGKLITSGRFGEYDEIGMSFEGERKASITDYGTGYTGEIRRDTYEGNTPPLFIWRDDSPRTELAYRQASSALNSIFNKSNIKPQFSLNRDGSDARCVMLTGSKKNAYYLINQKDTPVAQNTLKLSISKIIKSLNVEIYADGKLIKSKANIKNGMAEIILPSFEISCVVMTGK
ncbi:MAG: beta-galactosidase [Armatimonadota bacterium]